MPFPVHFRTTSGEVEAIFCLFPVSAYIKIENQNFVDRCTFVWSTWWRQKKFDKGRCLKKGHIVCIIKVRKWDGNFLTNLMLFPYVTKWGRSQLYYSSLITDLISSGWSCDSGCVCIRAWSCDFDEISITQQNYQILEWPFQKSRWDLRSEMLELLDLKKRFLVWFEPSWGNTKNNLRNIALNKILNWFHTLVKFWTTPLDDFRCAAGRIGSHNCSLNRLNESCPSLSKFYQCASAEALVEKS